MLILGPMPDAVRRAVVMRIAEADPADRLRGLFLGGGPGGCCYLDADGEVWNHCHGDDSVESIPDGPVKVSVVALATEWIPELAGWLPARPPGASDCEPCHGSGRLPLPLSHLGCPQCAGMGWLPPRAGDGDRIG